MSGVERVTPQMLRLLQVLVNDPDAEWWGLALAETAGVRSPTVYRSLARLEAAEWVRSRSEDVQVASDEGRPRRRLYRLTPNGAREATALLAEQRAKAGDRDAWPSWIPGPPLRPGAAH